jgi:hypothetical protein
MEIKKDRSAEEFVDVRFNLAYSIIIIIAGAAFAAWALLPGRDLFLKYYFVILGIIILCHGIYAISGAKYFTFDRNGKQFIFFRFFGFMKSSVRYDRLFFRGKELYRVFNNKTRYINLIRYQCRKRDLDILFKMIDSEINSTGS